MMKSFASTLAEANNGAPSALLKTRRAFVRFRLVRLEVARIIRLRVEGCSGASSALREA